MSGLSIKKVLEGFPGDMNHFQLGYPADLLFTKTMVIGTSGNASGKVEYIGVALPGTSKAQPRWSIKKLTYDASSNPIEEQFANGSSNFDKVFDSGASEYASYSYS